MYNPFQKFFDYLRYREAVIKADKAHATTGERYYVMPSTSGKLLIMDRTNFRGLKKKHYICYSAKVRDLINECFYLTPYRNDDGYLDSKGLKMKRALYYSWCEAFRKQKKLKKKSKKEAKNVSKNKRNKQ